MQLPTSHTLIKLAHVYDKMLSFDLTIFGITAYNTLCKSVFVQHENAFGAHRMGLHFQ